MQRSRTSRHLLRAIEQVRCGRELKAAKRATLVGFSGIPGREGVAVDSMVNVSVTSMTGTRSSDCNVPDSFIRSNKVGV